MQQGVTGGVEFETEVVKWLPGENVELTVKLIAPYRCWKKELNSQFVKVDTL